MGDSSSRGSGTEAAASSAEAPGITITRRPTSTFSDALDTLTRMRVNPVSTNVLDLEDPRIFDNPILYISEPGYWRISDKGAQNLRLHLLKGGLVIFDDFEHQPEFDNMAAQVAKALPERRWIKIDVSHPIFHSLFDLKKLDVPHPSVDVEPDYRALFVNDDPTIACWRSPTTTATSRSTGSGPPTSGSRWM
jgi:hypothetical protein